MRAFTGALAWLIAVASTAQSPIDLTLERLEVVNRQATRSGSEIHLDAAPGAGLAWLTGLDLNEGCLSLQVKGSNEEGRSFVGLAFRAENADIYDAVYVRPFVFQSEDPLRAANALQYMSLPDSGWPALRQRSPGVYEKSIGARPRPDDWVTLSIDFRGGRVRVFVADAVLPQLDVPWLTTRSAGRVALWVGNNSSGSFRRLRRCE